MTYQAFFHRLRLKGSNIPRVSICLDSQVPKQCPADSQGTGSPDLRDFWFLRRRGGAAP